MKVVDDPDFTLYQGDAIETLRELPDESVHCVVTSPPYWGLRDYQTGTWDGGAEDCDHLTPAAHGYAPFETSTLGPKRDGVSPANSAHDDRTKRQQFRDVCGKCGATRVDRQLGLEPTPDAYVAGMVAVFREVRRVLRSDGTCWINIGDSYSRSTGYASTGSADGGVGRIPAAHRGPRASGFGGLKDKDLCMIPARLALALQADGWYLRAEIIWSKPNPMPESVTDRPTKAHEQVFLLTKSPRYFFDQEAVRERYSENTHGGGAGGGNPNRRDGGRALNGATSPNGGRNVRSVWEIATDPYPDAHFATFPTKLARRCIVAGCPEWVCSVHGPVVGGPQACTECDRSCGPGVVLDPFMGSGTVALVAVGLGRRAVGVDLSAEYCRLAAERVSYARRWGERAGRMRRLEARVAESDAALLGGDSS